jgi:S-adenosylmethionine hydrolase
LKIARLITLTTDFGMSDSYVAQMKGVVLSINPGVTIIDVTHSIAPQDIRRAASIMADIAGAFPEGTIHVAVVDPGVGTARGLLAVEAAGQRFVAPDNGLLGLLLGRNPAGRIHRLSEDRFWRKPVSATFHGRDILAPVAAQWSLGIDIARFGPPVDPDQVFTLARPVVRRVGNSLIGEIELIDAFGNCISNISRAELPTEADVSRIRIEIAGRCIAGISVCYADRPPGAELALFGSSGLLEVALNQGDAAQSLGIEPGTEIRLLFS